MIGSAAGAQTQCQYGNVLIPSIVVRAVEKERLGLEKSTTARP